MLRLSGSLTTVMLVVTALAAGGCGAGDGEGGSGASGAGPTPSDGGFAHVGFTDITSAAGIVHANVSGEAKQKMAIPENIGQGAATLDYDGDGDLDLFLVNGDVFDDQEPQTDPRCALYRNDGAMTFTDVTEAAGLAFSGWCHGANVVDFDADGNPDIYVTCYLRDNLFFRNTGEGTFQDYSEQWGGADPGPSTASAFLDADGDGDLDLYVGNYVAFDPASPPNQGQPCEWKGLSVSCGPNGTPKAEDRFYENVDGRLTEATEKFGLNAAPAYTLGVVTCDFDNDGDVDLYVANDSVANYLFENLGDGKFKESAARYALDMQEDGRPQAGMGLDAGDVDNDGRFEFFVTNFSHDYNTLYRNAVTPSGRTHFSDSSYAMDLGEASFNFLSWGTRIVDIDNDGWQDIIVASGHVYPQVDNSSLDTSYAQHNQIFMNHGKTGEALVTFSALDNGETPGWDKQAVSRGLVSVDLDDDGDQEFLFLEMDAKPTLLRNDTKAAGHWVGFQVVGGGKNRDAIGARLEVIDSSGKSRWRERASGASFLSSCDPRLVVGLGSASGPVTLKIRWPSGKVQEISDLATGRYHVITE
ncbi:MAG: CRTAC1 family protein [Planctomycetota bacterium]|nr:CRTAC1 family protein [Planctomycetota bacterium]